MCQAVFAYSANELHINIFYRQEGICYEVREKLCAMRKEKGLTQAELAKLAGVGLRTITNYEKAPHTPRTVRVYSVLAQILGCDADHLHWYNEGDDFHCDGGAGIWLSW